MKALKSTNLVPVEFLVANGPYSKGQVAGLDPVMVKRLKPLKTPVIKEVAPPEDEETYTVDDETLAVIPDTPALGGYKHLPPLASNELPGRNRLKEERATPIAGLESPESPKSVEDRKTATTDDPGTDVEKTEAVPPSPPKNK